MKHILFIVYCATWGVILALVMVILIAYYLTGFLNWATQNLI